MDAKSQGLLEELRDNPNPFSGLGICFAAGDALAEIERLRSAIERARDILAEHHKWQCEAEGLTMEFERDGKIERVDISGEYGDSSLCEETMSVLAALNSELKT
jgi:membrane protein involved in colicin uptake